MNKQTYKRNQGGFTLIEMLIVVGLMVVLTGALVAAYSDVGSDAAWAKVQSNWSEGAGYAKNLIAQDRLDVSLGRPSSLPADTAGWTALLNAQGNPKNAQGGAAFAADSAGGFTDGTIGVKEATSTAGGGECGAGVTAAGVDCLVLEVPNMNAGSGTLKDYAIL